MKNIWNWLTFGAAGGSTKCDWYRLKYVVWCNGPQPTRNDFRRLGRHIFPVRHRWDGPKMWRTCFSLQKTPSAAVIRLATSARTDTDKKYRDLEVTFLQFLTRPIQCTAPLLLFQHKNAYALLEAWFRHSYPILTSKGLSWYFGIPTHSTCWL